MLMVITGGSGSGKSKLAEEYAMRLCPDQKIYIATMTARDEESLARIEMHKERRVPMGFVTLEQGVHMEQIDVTGESLVLLECMSNLVANEMYAPEGVREEVAEHIMVGIRHLKAQVKHLIIVTNEVFFDVNLDAQTKAYVDIMGDVNRKLSAISDVYMESVYGLPVVYKGGKA